MLIFCLHLAHVRATFLLSPVLYLTPGTTNLFTRLNILELNKNQIVSLLPVSGGESTHCIKNCTPSFFRAYKQLWYLCRLLSMNKSIENVSLL